MHIYVGTFLLALAILALEITLTRILSVTTYYHLAFLAISTAMLGMTAAATKIFLNPKHFSVERLETNLGRACFGFALAAPVSLVLLCLIPVELISSVMSLLGLLCVTAACTLPFYFAGIAITLVLTKSSLPIGFIYASDLVGAALGCLLVLVGLEFLDAPSLILLCAALGAAAGVVYLWSTPRRGLRTMNMAAAIALTAMTFINAQSSSFIRPLVVKGKIQPATKYALERWNSFSRVAVFPEATSEPKLWGSSPTTPLNPLRQRYMNIDGAAGTVMFQFESLDDIEHLRYDVTNVAHAVRPHGAACVIGVGGGKDVQSALLFGHSSVLGIDVNPIFVSLLKNQFRDFVHVADRKDVKLVVDEARSYLSRSNDKFSLLQMSLVDTWAATGAGAMTLSENALYTVEAWKVFIDRLEPDGLFTVSRWYDPDNLGETGRLVSLAAMVLLENGVTHPAGHLALVTQGRVATLILSKQPMSGEDVDALNTFCAQMEFNVVATPIQSPRHPLLRSLLAVRSPSELLQVRQETPYRFDPTTDEDPHFFNILRLRDALNFFGQHGVFQMLAARETGMIRGNVIATTVLVGLIVILAIMSVLTVVVPLVLRPTGDDPDFPVGKIVWSGALYFSLIGAGFMLLEIAMMQRLSVFLGHPMYGLGIVLCLLILSSGVGSFLSERLPLTRTPWVYGYLLLLAATIIAARFVLTAMMTHLVAAPMPAKIACSVLAIFPVGILLGFCFPTGMRLVRRVDPAETPWYWALNGIFGVLSSAVAVFISIFIGISTNFYLAAGCYLLAALCVVSIVRRHTLASPIEMCEDAAAEPLSSAAG
jgi:spermidine synthase